MKSLLDADYAAIEARIVCWLAGQEDALEEYQDGVDRYKRMASFIFRVPEDQVNKHPQRFIGKQAILLCGFQGGGKKFRQTCEKFGYREMPIGLEDTAVKTYRAKHKQVVKYWYDVEECATRAIVRKGETVHLRNIAFQCRDIEGTTFLLIKLPSGRKLAYPRPRIGPSKKFEGKTAIYFFGNIVGTQWGEIDTYGGKLVENCLSGETEVLSEKRGWVALQTITKLERVFDGVEFVFHQGLIAKGKQNTIAFNGLHVTPNHMFLAGQKWVSAQLACTNPRIKLSSLNEVSFFPSPESALRFDSGNIWPFAGHPERQWDQKNHLDLSLRLREGSGESRFRIAEETRQDCGLWLSMPFGKSSHRGSTSNAQHDTTPSVCGASQYAGTVLQSKAPSLGELWGAWDNCLLEMARIFPSFLGGYGANIQTRFRNRQEGQRWKLHPAKLPLGNASKEYPQQKEYLSTSRSTAGFLGHCFEEGDKENHPLLSLKSGANLGTDFEYSSEPRKLVYDILNCGPRQCFAVRGTTGHILIAHNCTQAVAADIMCTGAQNAEASKYEIAALIHDQALAYYQPWQTVEEFVGLLTALPPWADGLPIEAEGALVPFYKKD